MATHRESLPSHEKGILKEHGSDITRCADYIEEGRKALSGRRTHFSRFLLVDDRLLNVCFCCLDVVFRLIHIILNLVNCFLLLKGKKVA